MESKGEIKYSCVVDTTYSLALYLLMQSEEAIRQTAFFIGNAIPQNAVSLLPNVIKIDNRKENYLKWKKLKHRINALIRWRFRNKTIMYAQDHLRYSAHIIGRNKYILLEDAPNIYLMYETIRFMKPIAPTSFFSKTKDYLLFGPIGRKRLGTNKQCIDRLVTSTSNIESELLKNGKYTLVSLNDLWENSTDTKKKYIMDMFEISSDMFEIVKKSDVVIFTQPLMSDCNLTEQEMADIYKPYIEKFCNDGIVIKPHPRDNFNYHKWFPETYIMKCKAPMQLLSAIGMNFKVAITVCSSAVSSMPQETKIIWIGTSVNEKIHQVYGNLQCPPNLTKY